ncbi:MAG: RraA family protein [Chloroflexota bacterium]|nr:RraA family protein [Chloroflexota bacterium]MEC9451736.1 RraA family protein [Chloroflexota bacterium]MQG04743.1 RraA family protein [SAR202 cluster bacterium]|tara:strand:- start:6719 stop:7372 length:654 start_codon:yes stop_codon:yes gene_type:complete
MQKNNLVQRLEKCYTGAVYDVLRERGNKNSILPHEIKSIDPSKKLAGEIWTCSGEIDETLDKDTTMLSWTEMLSKAPSGSVIMCQPNDGTIAHMGELSAETLKYRGVKGYIVDGGCRDVDFILNLGFPVFCKYFTPSDVVCRWKITSLGEPIKIGDLIINSGDYVLGDIDGVVVIPKEIASEVISETEDYINTESALRKDILSGVDPQEAYLKYRVF